MVIVVLHSDTSYCYLYFPLSPMVIVVLHSDTLYCYLYFHSAWWWLLSYMKILHHLLHSDTFYCYLYFHSAWRWLLSYSKIPPLSPTFRKLLICAFPLSQMVIVVLQEDPTLSPTFRRLLLVCVLPLSLMWLVSYRKILHRLLHSDTFYGYVYFHSVWWWLMSHRKILHCRLHSDAFYCHLYFHSGLMVIVILHSDTFYCYLYFH